MKEFATPLLALHGTGDMICPVSATKRFYEMAGSSDKTIKLFIEGFHVLRLESHNGIKDVYYNVVTNWLVSHSSNS